MPGTKGEQSGYILLQPILWTVQNRDSRELVRVNQSCIEQVASYVSDVMHKEK